MSAADYAGQADSGCADYVGYVGCVFAAQIVDVVLAAHFVGIVFAAHIVAYVATAESLDWYFGCGDLVLGSKSSSDVECACDDAGVGGQNFFSTIS